MPKRKLKIAVAIAFLVSFITTCASAQPATHMPLTKALKDSLRQEIETMVANDQRYRWILMFAETDERKLADLKKLPQNEQSKRIKDVLDHKIRLSARVNDSLGQLQDAIDSANFTEVCGIIYKYGYPKKYVDVAKVSVLLMHANPRWMTSDIFKTLKEEVINGNMPAFEYATIYDRTQLGLKLPELYYVMEHYDAKTGTSAIGKPLDIDATNKAREEIGLKRIKD